MRDTLRHIVDAAIAGVDPVRAVHGHVRRHDDVLHVDQAAYDLAAFKRVLLLGAGKAAAPMALAMEDILGEHPVQGFVVTKYGHGLEGTRSRCMEAGHPVPDRAGLDAARTLLGLARQCSAEDLALVLLSGGASALLPAPRPPLTLAHKQEATRLLLLSGAHIGEVNAVRKHLSLLKGGGLAKALAPASAHALLISDVMGDDPSTIASGPLAPDPTTFQDCLRICRERRILDRLPGPVKKLLEQGVAGDVPETLKPGDPALHAVRHAIIAANADALAAAAQAARGLGYEPRILDTPLRGEARDMARVLARAAVDAARSAQGRPLCLLAGGETTVTVRGQGTGGRNQELALALALALDAHPGERARIHSACVGTDGTDGPTDAAGALALPDILERARALGLDPHAALTDNDSHTFFSSLGGLIRTGPTRTNVMDLAVLLIA